MTTCIAPHPRPTSAYDDLYVCQTHFERIPGYMSEIVDLYALLDELMEPGSQGKAAESVTVAVSKEAPVPVRLEAVVLRDERSKPIFMGHRAPGATIVIVHSWAIVVREERNLVQPETKATVSSETDTLITHWRWIASQPWCDEFISEIMEAHQDLLDATNFEARRVKVGTCSRVLEDETLGDEVCGGPMFMSLRGSICAKCHYEHIVPDYQIEAASQMLDMPMRQRRIDHARHAATVRWASR
jgi:hypothetical protein